MEVRDPIRTYLKEESRLQKGKYRLRNTIYVFSCVKGCGSEIHLRKADIKKASGRCRACADKDSGKLSSVANRKRPFEALYNKFVYDRKRFKQECSITYDDFVKFTKISECHYCGNSIKWATHALATNSGRYNLDRLDNEVGYHKDNCVVCCWSCNEMKKNKSFDAFLEKCSNIFLKRKSLKVKFKRLTESAVIPAYAKVGDAGLDLTSTSKEWDEEKQLLIMGTGLCVEIPQGYVGLLFPRSSICKTPLDLANSVGVIDSGYRGEIKFMFRVVDRPRKGYEIGDRVGQLVILPFPTIQPEEATELSSSERGEGGFGSSGS